ncbi:MAG: GDSL-type esterase/lipase family protein, partial [Scytonema sp. PMC 1069.18]|nr:GDSL-type esterase/lipase family protein [Scytonema sp. PMC 1069.18]
GYLVGWIDQNEWLTYNINVPTTGVYRVEARIASAVEGNYSLKTTVGGQETIVNFSGTGGWRNWQNAWSVGQLSLSAGTQQLRLDMLTGNFNLNYINLIPVSSIDYGNVIQGGTGNNIFSGNSDIDTVVYEQAKGRIHANLNTGVVNHKFATSPNQAFKIMPLGDSNTFGMIEWDSGAYRDDLWYLLKSDLFNIDFVGPRSTGPDGFDKDNAGFGGWRIRDIASNQTSQGNVNVWLDTYKPDMTLLMIGTNDILKDDYISDAPTRLSNLIDQITNRLPSTELLVASIAPIATTPEKAQQGADFNATIPGIVNNKIIQGKKVSFVDVYSALTPNDLQDNIHPTPQGYNKVADVWHQAILDTNIGKDTLTNIDNIVGSPFDDIIVGNGDNNVIDGNDGKDLLTGGNGKDTFIIAPGKGTDTITDFNVSMDLLALSGGLTFGDLMIQSSQTGLDTLINYNNQSLASLMGVQASSVKSNVFTIV